MFCSASFVGDLTVFDVGGNKYHIAGFASYRKQIVYIYNLCETAHSRRSRMNNCAILMLCGHPSPNEAAHSGQEGGLSNKGLGLLVRSIREFGWTNPILVRPDGGIIAGHARLSAALKLGLAGGTGH